MKIVYLFAVALAGAGVAEANPFRHVARAMPNASTIPSHWQQTPSGWAPKGEMPGGLTIGGRNWTLELADGSRIYHVSTCYIAEGPNEAANFCITNDLRPDGVVLEMLNEVDDGELSVAMSYRNWTSDEYGICKVRVSIAESGQIVLEHGDFSVHRRAGDLSDQGTGIQRVQLSLPATRGTYLTQLICDDSHWIGGAGIISIYEARAFGTKCILDGNNQCRQF